MPFFFPCIRCWDCGISQCNPKRSFIKFVHEQLPKREQLLRQENSRQIRMIQLKCRSILTANVTSPAAELPEDITADAAPTEQPVGTPPQPNSGASPRAAFWNSAWHTPLVVPRPKHTACIKLCWGEIPTIWSEVAEATCTARKQSPSLCSSRNSKKLYSAADNVPGLLFSPCGRDGLISMLENGSKVQN